MKLTITNKNTNKESKHKVATTMGITEIIAPLLKDNQEIIESFKIEIEAQGITECVSIEAVKEIIEDVEIEVEYKEFYEDVKSELKYQHLNNDEEIAYIRVRNKAAEIEVEADIKKTIDFEKEQIVANPNIVEDTIEELENDGWEVEATYIRENQKYQIKSWSSEDREKFTNWAENINM